MATRALIMAAVLLAASPAGAQLARKKRELARIQSELRKTLAELDELRASQQSLGQAVSRLQGLDTGARRRLESFQAGVRRAESRREELRMRLEAARHVAGFWSAALSAETARLDAAMVADSGLYGRASLWAEEFRRTAILEKTRHLRGLQGFGRRAEEDESLARRRAAELDESRRRAQAERDARRREYEAKKAELAQTQSRAAEAARKAKELEDSAAAMTALIERLGRAARGRRLAAGAPARLDLPLHSLPWPVEGRVLSSFGREKDARLGTWVVHQGLLLGTASGAEIAAVAAGHLIFAGSFRSYGKVAILDHGGGFFSVYGELAEILKHKGDEVAAGEFLARAGSAEDGGGRVYLELRRGTQALDPALWLKERLSQ